MNAVQSRRRVREQQRISIMPMLLSLRIAKKWNEFTLERPLLRDAGQSCGQASIYYYCRLSGKEAVVVIDDAFIYFVPFIYLMQIWTCQARGPRYRASLARSSLPIFTAAGTDIMEMTELRAA